MLTGLCVTGAMAGQFHYSDHDGVASHRVRTPSFMDKSPSPALTEPILYTHRVVVLSDGSTIMLWVPEDISTNQALVTVIKLYSDYHTQGINR